MNKTNEWLNEWMKEMRGRKGKDEARAFFFFFQLERSILNKIITYILLKESDAISQEWEHT